MVTMIGLGSDKKTSSYSEFTQSLNGIIKLPNKSRRYQKKDKAKATEGIKTTDYNFVGRQYITVKKMQYCKCVWRDGNKKHPPCMINSTNLLRL